MTAEGETSVANFIQKSFQILEQREYEGVIHWMANGREFAIKEIEQFQDHILPKYFRHRNINSFIRQLNMYGFHKSRKDPTKNIFSHPCFLKNHPQLLPQVKRKIKNEDKQEAPIAPEPLQTPTKGKTEAVEPPTTVGSHKPTPSFTLFRTDKDKENDAAPTKTEIVNSVGVLSLRSFGVCEVSPLRGLMEKSCVMDSNPQIYLRMREGMGHNLIEAEEEDDDNISIEDEIERERRVFMNRRSGVTILHTRNLLEDEEHFQS